MPSPRNNVSTGITVATKECQTEWDWESDLESIQTWLTETTKSKTSRKLNRSKKQNQMLEEPHAEVCQYEAQNGNCKDSEYSFDGRSVTSTKENQIAGSFESRPESTITMKETTSPVNSRGVIKSQLTAKRLISSPRDESKNTTQLASLSSNSTFNSKSNFHTKLDKLVLDTEELLRSTIYGPPQILVVHKPSVSADVDFLLPSEEILHNYGEKLSKELLAYIHQLDQAARAAVMNANDGHEMSCPFCGADIPPALDCCSDYAEFSNLAGYKQIFTQKESLAATSYSQDPMNGGQGKMSEENISMQCRKEERKLMQQKVEAERKEARLKGQDRFRELIGGYSGTGGGGQEGSGGIEGRRDGARGGEGRGGRGGKERRGGKGVKDSVVGRGRAAMGELEKARGGGPQGGANGKERGIGGADIGRREGREKAAGNDTNTTSDARSVRRNAAQESMRTLLQQRRASSMQQQSTSSTQGGGAGISRATTFSFLLSSKKCYDDGWTLWPRFISFTTRRTVNDFSLKPASTSVIEPVEFGCDDNAGEFVVQRYKNGNIFLIKFPDGSGNVLYFTTSHPSGRLAITVTSDDRGHHSFVIQEDTNDADIVGVFKSNGHAVTYSPSNQRIRLHLNTTRGVELTGDGGRKRRWLWHEHIDHHSSSIYPITCGITPGCGLRIMSQRNISVTYRAETRHCKLHVGAKIKRLSAARMESADDDEVFRAQTEARIIFLLAKLTILSEFVNSPRPEKIALPQHIINRQEKLDSLHGPRQSTVDRLE